MYEIRERRRTLDDGTELTTYARDIAGCNVLEVEAGTTGFQGGDTGHGGRTYLRIQDHAGTDMTVHRLASGLDGDGFEVILGGDCELETMIRALRFAAQVLEDGAREVSD